MPNQTEQPIQLQADNVQTLPGGGIRTIGVTIPSPTGAAPLAVQQQVVVVADANGVPIDFSSLLETMGLILAELRDLKKMLAGVNGYVAFDVASPNTKGF